MNKNIMSHPLPQILQIIHKLPIRLFTSFEPFAGGRGSGGTAEEKGAKRGEAGADDGDGGFGFGPEAGGGEIP